MLTYAMRNFFVLEIKLMQLQLSFALSIHSVWDIRIILQRENLQYNCSHLKHFEKHLAKSIRKCSVWTSL